ncbi:MAG: N-acetylmuramoyl-L-alanine amidase [Crocinitomicaceae bacterium]|jgi:N-acetyl-anhydromuramyl-L-alanine amidase AmpD
MNKFLNQIIDCPLPDDQYYKEVYNKRQIVIHHTVSNGNAKNVIASWQKTKEKVGVAFVVDREGKVYKAFSSAHWAHHLGTKEINNTILNKQSIGIELCSWGALTFKNGIYYTISKEIIPKEEVITYVYPFRENRYFQKYTDKQLESLKLLLQYLCETYKIPKTYIPEMWEISKSALRGDKGIFTHVSYRKDKSDCHPQKELEEVLKSL